MLKSTHGANKQGEKPPLPPGWTEHTAPSGHTYYYNSETKKSTYTRPTVVEDTSLHIDYNATQPDYTVSSLVENQQYPGRPPLDSPQNGSQDRSHFTGGRSYQDRWSRRRAPEDRPKSRAAIPNCVPWVLVKTKLGRRFVHNTETKESLWKFPQDVMLAVIEMDRLEWEAKQSEDAAKQTKTEKMNGGQSKNSETRQDAPQQRSEIRDGHDDSSSYEEVEVTDSEGEEESTTQKRLRTSSTQPQDGPTEFTESDMAYQLAQMGEDYGLDPSEYDHPEEQDDDDDDDQGLPLTTTDAVTLFKSLLDDFQINPYTTFDHIIEDDATKGLVDDNRYTVLPNTTRRRAVFDQWSRDRIQRLRRERDTKQKSTEDPKVDYLHFLSRHAAMVGKLFWAEFRRKVRKEDRITALNDKDKEKLFRDFAVRLKVSEGERRKELGRLVKEVEQKEWKGLTEGEVPPTLAKDVRYWVVPQKEREGIVEAHVASLKS